VTDVTRFRVKMKKKGGLFCPMPHELGLNVNTKKYKVSADGKNRSDS
jgi:hypothetical protein